MKAKHNNPPKSDPQVRYVSAEVIAKKYSITSRYVLLLAAEGKIPSLRLGKQCVRFSLEDVAAAIEKKGGPLNEA